MIDSVGQYVNDWVGISHVLMKSVIMLVEKCYTENVIQKSVIQMTVWWKCVIKRR